MSSDLGVSSLGGIQFDVFQDLSEAEIQQIVDATTRLTFASGQSVCQQGDQGHSMYFLSLIHI